jgi:hypothetical protein
MSIPFLLPCLTLNPHQQSLFLRNIRSRYPQPEAQCLATTTVHARQIETREGMCLAQDDMLVRPMVVFVPCTS